MSASSPEVTAYIECFPSNVRRLLRTMRATIRKAAPKAQETISYGIPAYKQRRVLVWFAAHTNHVGFYPGASGIRAFKKDLARYTSAKGSVQFRFDEPLPLALITRMVKFRARERA
ncbi:MAG: iron chaperone [Candidatus Tyrphobacter sp.]